MHRTGVGACFTKRKQGMASQPTIKRDLESLDYRMKVYEHWQNTRNARMTGYEFGLREDEVRGIIQSPEFNLTTWEYYT